MDVDYFDSIILKQHLMCLAVNNNMGAIIHAVNANANDSHIDSHIS